MTTDEKAIQVAEDGTMVLTPDQKAMREQAANNVGEEALVIPILHLFQGLQSERDRFGNQDLGSWIDTISGDVLSDAKNESEVYVVPVLARSYRAAWYRRNSLKGEGAPVCTWGTNDPRPTTDRDGNPIPWDDPDLGEFDHIDLFVLVGDASLPRLYRAKSTTLKGVKPVCTIERERAAEGKVAGRYKLHWTERNKGGNKSAIPRFVPCGNADAADMERWFAAAKLLLDGGARIADERGGNVTETVDEVPF